MAGAPEPTSSLRWPAGFCALASPLPVVFCWLPGFAAADFDAVAVLLAPAPEAAFAPTGAFVGSTYGAPP